MLRFFGYVMALGLLSLGWAAQPAKPAARKAPVKKSGAKSTARKTPSKSTSKSASSKSGTRRASTGKTTSRKTTSRKTASWRNRQIQPTPERYKQIQEALAAKGYLAPEDAGASWGPKSVEALKRFQADQKIDGAGKINSLSLIALGLGPKRENLATAKPQTPPSPGQ